MKKIQLSLPEGMFEQLEEVRTKREINRNEFIREAIRVYLAAAPLLPKITRPFNVESENVAEHKRLVKAAKDHLIEVTRRDDYPF